MNIQQNNHDEMVENSNEVFKQFWQHYSVAFYNYNMTQFAQISSVFKMPMPMPTKIKELGDRYLKQFFDDVWSQKEPNNFIRSNEFLQQPTYNPQPQFLNQSSQSIFSHSNNSGQQNYYRRNQNSRFNSLLRHQKWQGFKRRDLRDVTKETSMHGKHSYTSYSDDESSERAARGQRTGGNQTDIFNKKAVNRLGFMDD